MGAHGPESDDILSNHADSWRLQFGISGSGADPSRFEALSAGLLHEVVHRTVY